jgi:hypothetical protein
LVLTTSSWAAFRDNAISEKVLAIRFLMKDEASELSGDDLKTLKGVI